MNFVSVLTTGLKQNFQDVSLEIVDCPDLTKAPFHLAAQGLGGAETIVEFGAVPYLLPLVNLKKIYDLKSMLGKINQPPFFVVGAGAGCHSIHNQNCEGMVNLKVNADGTTINETHIALVNPDKGMRLEKVPTEETRVCLLGNLFMSEGKSGKVLKVHCKKRIGPENFISAMRLTLTKHYPEDQTIGMGGVFLLKNGKAKQHVMDAFSKTPLNNEEDLNNWLQFYDMEAPLINLGTFVTNEADLDLRLQHFHSFSKHGLGGHYHYDTTPDTVEYEGYFSVGKKIVRIDKPEVTHKWGRD